MYGSNPYFRTNTKLKYDHIFGFRGWGLILYGTLPSNLFALGVLEFTEIHVNRFGSMLSLLILAIIPISVLFLLVLERLKAWYLMSDGLWIRSGFITFMILILSTIIGLSAGVITGKYLMISWQEWMKVSLDARLSPLLESFFVSIIALIGSSTLFLTAVKESNGLPGLPTQEFVDDIRSLRRLILKIQNHAIWRAQRILGLTDLADDSRSARQIIVQIVNKSSSRFGHQEFYEILIKDLMALERTIDQVERIPLKWRDYFAVIEPLGLNSDELKLRAAIHNVKKVRIDA